MTDLPSPLEDRLADLESKISFQEDLLEQLNLTVYRQQEQIDRLLQQQRALAGRLTDGAAGAGLGDPLSDRPPHY